MHLLKTVLRVVAIAMLLLQYSAMATAKNYAVGGTRYGWSTANDLQNWANSNKFFVGDSLSFKYTEGNEVVQVWKAGYDACNPSNHILISATGDTNITLTSPGVCYFIAGIQGECLAGMKVAITVLSPSQTTPSPSPPPPAYSAASPVPAASPASRVKPPPPPCKSPASGPSKKSHTKSHPIVHDNGSPKSAPSPSGAIQSSSADKIDVVVGFVMGLGFTIMMLLSSQI